MSESKNVAPMPSRAAAKRLGECQTLQEAFQTAELKSLVAAAIPKHLNPETMLRTWVQAASRQPLIYEVDLRQALGAFQSLAYLGLVPNTALQHAHLIPFKRRKWNPKTKARDIEVVDLQVVIGYPGYIDLGHRSGAVQSMHADVVWDRGAEGFSYSYGSRKHLDHNGVPPGFRPAGLPQYAYCHVALTGGGEQFEVMTWPEIEAIRNRSQGYQSALMAKEEAEGKNRRAPPKWSEAPWVRDPVEMGKKTVVRRNYKWIPKAPELIAASALEDAVDRGTRMDFGPIIDGTLTPFDGIPTTEDEDQPEDPPANPGAAFTDRRQQAPQSAPQPRPAGRAPDTREPANAPPDGPDPGRFGPPVGAPSFGAVLVDGMGDSTNEVYTDPVLFARAAAALWGETVPPDRQAFLEHNADGLEDARTNDEARLILSEVELPAGESDAPDDAAVQDGEILPPPKTIEPPMERGKVSWTGYVRLLKAALGELEPRDLDAWAQAQLEVLSRAPRGQQLVVVAAIVNAYKLQGWSEPRWVAEMTRGSQEEAAGQESGGPPGAPDAAARARQWLSGAKPRIERCAKPADLVQFRQQYASEIGWVMTNGGALARELKDFLDAKEQELQPRGEG